MLCMNVFCIVLMNGYYVPCTIMPNKYRIVINIFVAFYKVAWRQWHFISIFIHNGYNYVTFMVQYEYVLRLLGDSDISLAYSYYVTFMVQ